MSITVTRIAEIRRGLRKPKYEQGWATDAEWMEILTLAQDAIRTRPEAGSRTIASFKPDELDLIVDHYFANTIDLMHEGCHDKIREAVHGIFQDIRVGRCEPQPERE